MHLTFVVGGEPGEFRRNPRTGRAELRVGDDVMCLQSPFRLSTHFDFRTRVGWRRRVGEHEVEIVKVRPVAFAGLRQNTVTVTVDEVVVAEATGK
jgi:hypothetical protein